MVAALDRSVSKRKVRPVPYLTCPRCGLTLRAEGRYSPTDACPRCRGRHDLRVPLFATSTPHDLFGARFATAKQVA